MQIVTEFAMRMKVLANCEDIMQRADEKAKVLHGRLLHSGRYLSVHEKRLGGVYLYGKPVIEQLSIFNRAALERLLNQRIPLEKKFQHHLRFSKGVFLCSSSSYERSVKRRNDLLTLRDGSLCKVKNLVIVAPDCTCDGDGCIDCYPESYPLVLLQKLQVVQTSFFTDRNLNIHFRDVLLVQGTAETLAVRVDELEAKCVAVEHGRKVFAIPMQNNFETD